MIKFDDRFLKIFFLGLIVFAIYFFTLIPTGFLETYRLTTLDYFFRLAHKIKSDTKPPIDITLVTIDDESLAAIGKKWPWDRSYFAKIVNKIAGFNPKVIALDFTFSGQSKNPEEDRHLAEAFSNAGNVIFASYLTRELQYLPLNEDLVKASWGTGFVNKPKDIDHKVRRTQLVQYRYGQAVPEFAFEAVILAKFLDLDLDALKFDSENIIFTKDLIISLEEARNIPIYYSYTYNDLPHISLIDLMKDTAPGKDIEGKIILVGARSVASQDFHGTPLGILSGMVLNANVISTLRNNYILKKINLNVKIAILLVIFLISILITYYSTFTKGIISMALLTISVFYLFFWSFLRWELIMPVFDSLFILGLTFATVNIYKYINLLYRTARLRRLAITDTTTGLATSRYFHYKLQADLTHAKRHRGELALIIFILNQFKEILTEYDFGHIEKLLQHVSEILKYNSRKKADLLTRLGEDRFAAILPRTNIKEAVSYANKIQKKLHEVPFRLPGENFKLDLNIGVVTYPELEAKTAYDFIKCAESSANRAKQNQETLCVFDPKTDGLPLESHGKNAEISEKDQMSYLTMDLEERNKELIANLRELTKSQKGIQEAYFNTIKSLVRALEEKDPYTAGHSERVCKYAVAIANELNLPKEKVGLIQQSAMLHDIGKIGMKDEILHKRGPLTNSEHEIMKNHAIAGGHILGETKFFEKHIPLIIHHHERYDGRGYPHGISGNSIPMGAQLIALADTLDAMTTGRGYNKVMTLKEALEEIKKNSGTQFNPIYADALVSALKEKN